MVPLVIRKMSEDDLPDVLDIETISSVRPWTRRAFYEELYNPHSFVFVCLLEGRMTAYICISQVIDEGHILKISVHPNYRRFGIATRLMNHALSFLRSNGCRRVFLEVRTGNRPAIEMYRKIGFDEVRRRIAYYREPTEDALEMRLVLEE